MKAIIILAMAAGLLSVSCSRYPSFEKQQPYVMGQGAVSYEAELESVYSILDEPSTDAKLLGTAVAAAVGAGSGQMLGSGSGRAVSSVGFGAAGALAGYLLGTQVSGGVNSERLTVRYGNGRRTTFTQQIFKEFGPLQAGMIGTLYVNGDRCCFVPAS